MSPDPRDGEFVATGPAPDRLDRVLRSFRPQLSWAALRELIHRGKVFVAGECCRDAATPVRPGQSLAIRVAAPRAGGAAGAPVRPQLRLVHCDKDLVVVDKPAGIPTVPHADADEATLVDLLRAELGGPVFVVQRLDRDTTGVLMFARNPAAELHLGQQLRRHTVLRRYLALVHGRAEAGVIRSFLAPDRGDGLRGSVHDPRLGKEAVTQVEVVEALPLATLVACHLETGRTHQIRIHLAEQGHMLLGERGYVREHKGQVLAAPRILLHAEQLGCVHPRGGERVHFAAPMPPDMLAVLASLRG